MLKRALMFWGGGATPPPAAPSCRATSGSSKRLHVVEGGLFSQCIQVATVKACVGVTYRSWRRSSEGGWRRAAAPARAWSPALMAAQTLMAAPLEFPSRPELSQCMRR